MQAKSAQWCGHVSQAMNRPAHTPTATATDDDLVPVGYVAYNENKPTAMFNDKIILAPNRRYSSGDREAIDNVFKSMDYFDNPVWY